MKKVAIFGGTFDPIHNGHLHIAYEALYRLNLDKIIFIPSGNPPHKLKNNITDSYIRYELVKTAIEDEKKFSISDYEIKQNKVSYTYKTLDYFTKTYCNYEWYFLTGVDCLMDLESWKNISIVLSQVKLAVFNRPGFNRSEILVQKSKIENKYRKNIIFLDIPLLDISSTGVRKFIKEGRNTKYFLPKNVYNIINKLQLYK